ncbi:MAG: hypothetical protein JWM27_4383 [Gemmatimonadetes bacterium]|nr:hypothetical protein [Gemmatimonadota bacterium]
MEPPADTPSHALRFDISRHAVWTMFPRRGMDAEM